MIKYPALVKQEAKNLKKFATKEELERLNLKDFDPENPENCVYGCMTGSCWSGRAVELIQNCCSRVYKSGFPTDAEGRISKTLNGSPKKSARNAYWSPIEAFIYIYKNRRNGANERLIKYLKGEIKRL